MNRPAPDFWKPVGSLTVDDVSTLLGKPEKSVLDYKQALNPTDMAPEKLAEDLCAFANAGLGRLVIGAEEGDRDQAARLSGMPSSLVKACRSKIRNAAHAVQPPVQVEIQDIDVGGRFVLVVEVRGPSPGGPHQYRGTYLTRAGDGIVFMTHSSVVQAVLTEQGRSSKTWGPPSDGFGTNSPFGSAGSSGWFLGVQLEFVHAPTLPVFEVFDEIGERLKTRIGGSIDGGGEPEVGLNRIFMDATDPDGPALKRRLQITTSGCASAFCSLRGTRVDAATLIKSTARADIVQLAQLILEATPAALVAVALRLWSTSAEPLLLVWDDDVWSLPAGVSYADRISRPCLLSELDHPQSPLLDWFVSRTQKRLPIFAKESWTAQHGWIRSFSDSDR